MTLGDLIALLKKDETPYGIFVLAGEEGYLIRHYLNQLRKKIVPDPSFASFNHMVFEGAEIDFVKLGDALRTPPVFADAKLVEWHLPDLDALKENDIASLADLASEAKETQDTLIVLLPEVGAFDMGTAKRPSAMYKKLSSVVEIIACEKAGDSQLMTWLTSHFTHEGVKVAPDALRELLDRCGHSMDILAEETKKLAAYVKANNLAEVTVDVVRHVSCPSTEEDAFGLTNALMAMDAKGAFENLADLRARRVEPTILLAQISRFITDMLSVGLLAEAGQTATQIAASLKLNEYKVKLYMKASRQHSTGRLRRGVSLCREADAQVKLTYGLDAYAAIERLVATLLA